MSMELEPRQDSRVSARVATLMAVWLGLAAGLYALTGCGDDDDYPYYAQCRYRPALCAGAPGAACRADLDCDVGYDCCTEPKCGGGMCTSPCRGDLDCAPGMACEHDKCFFACRHDLDCAVGQHCAHGRVCEWR